MQTLIFAIVSASALVYAEAILLSRLLGHRRRAVLRRPRALRSDPPRTSPPSKSSRRDLRSVLGNAVSTLLRTPAWRAWRSLEPFQRRTQLFAGFPRRDALADDEKRPRPFESSEVATRRME
jgi:hypothetical protein